MTEHKALTIRTRGLKEHDHEVELSKLTIVSAPNEAGKSTLAEAIRFAALGYVPALGKRQADTAALMRGGKMEVEIQLWDGRTFRRELSRAPRGALAGATECSWLKNAKAGEHAAEITKLFGAEEADVAEVLDVRVLLNAKPNERAERIEGLMAAGTKAPKELATRIAELATRRLAEKEDDKLEDWTALLKVLQPEQRTALKNQGGMILGKITDGGIPAALAWANEKKREAANDLKKHQAARAELERRLSELPKVDADNVAGLVIERDRLTREMGALGERMRTAIAKRGKVERAQEALQKAEEKLKNVQIDVEEIERVRKQVQADREKLRELEGEDIGGAVLARPAPPDLSEVEDLDTKAKDVTARAEAIEIPEIPSTAREEAEAERLERALQDLKASPWTQVHTIAMDLDASPLLAEPLREKIHRLIELAGHQIGAAPDELHSQFNAAQSALRAALDRAAQIRDQAETAKQAKWRLQGEATQLHEQADELRRKILADHAARAEERDRVREDHSSAVRILRKSVEERECRLATAERDVEQIKADHRAAKAARDALGEAPEEVSGDERLRLQDQLDRAHQELDALTSAAAARTELERLVASIEKLGVERQVYTAIEWGAQRAREEGISTAEGPLVATMIRFLEAAGRTERPYFRASKGHVEIGWSKPDVGDVDVRVLSGAAYTLFTAALVSAVLAVRKAPVRILLVEAGEADARSLAQLTDGIAAVAGELTAALVMTHLDGSQKPLGSSWTALRLEPQAAGVQA